MAGNAGEARKYVFLLFISVFYALGFHVKEEPIFGKEQRLRLLAIRRRRRRTEEYFFNYKGKVVNGKSLGFLNCHNSGSSSWF